MKVGTVKKMIMLAEGFSYNKSLEAFYSQGSTWIHFKNIQAWEFYPILLYRAVEGWNNKHSVDWDILSHSKGLVYCSPDEFETYLNKVFSDYTKTDYLTPQEQAVEACLIELLEKSK